MKSTQHKLVNDLYNKLYKESQIKLAHLQARKEQEMLNIYGECYNLINKKLKKLYDTYAKNGVLTNNQATIYNRMKTLKNEVTQEIVKTQKASVLKIKEMASEQFNESFFRTSWALSIGGQINISYGPIPVNALEYLSASPMSNLGKSKLILNSCVTNIKDIQNEIGKSLVMGTSYKDLSRKIGVHLGVRKNTGNKYSYANSGSFAKLMRISRTEGQRALVAGQMMSYKQSEDLGLNVKQRWDATLDDRVRPSHLALNGTFKSDNGWWVQEYGIWAIAPMHTGIAEFDINCRCRITGVLDVDNPLLENVKKENIQTYREFRERNKFIKTSENKEKVLKELKGDKYKLRGNVKPYSDDKLFAIYKLFEDEKNIDLNKEKIKGYMLVEKTKRGIIGKLNNFNTFLNLTKNDFDKLEHIIKMNLQNNKELKIILNAKDKYGQRINCIIPLKGSKGVFNMFVNFMYDEKENKLRLVTGYCKEWKKK